MKCPHCKSKKTKVIDTREKEFYRYRRYECFDYKKRFSTMEIIKNYKDIPRFRK